MRGACSVTVNGTRHDIGLHDAIYIPRDSKVVVETTGEVDLVECAAEVDGTTRCRSFATPSCPPTRS
jgi:hypothetical protein